MPGGRSPLPAWLPLVWKNMSSFASILTYLYLG
uniref:Macaca fascicularis brain cDNA clone: QflA-16273, similar to human 5'-3' exoribonuclease 2 (XRN2), mRNA, RefSeq: NM_012255.2 n=1 Tax=Macaca fascicularis TaxID=9541 RepID=I7G4Z1_MACFA|nr:unnamed protein product [Macaca fascicularis]